MAIELMVSVWPEVDWTSENYEEMKQKGLLVKAEKGIDLAMLFNGTVPSMDATNPRARDMSGKNAGRITLTRDQAILAG